MNASRLEAKPMVGLLLAAFISAAPAMAADGDMKAGATFKDCATCPEMVVVPPGSFTKGRDGVDPTDTTRYEGKPHRVTIGYSFAVGKTEITTGQFKEFVDATGHQANMTCNIWDGKTAFSTPNTGWVNPQYGRPPAADEPGACLSWVDAKAYIKWLNAKTGKTYRLLTESEWEYAARAGDTTTLYTWGTNPDDACKTANVSDLSSKNAKPPFIPRPFAPANCDDGFPAIGKAGGLAPNAFGLHDMIGSVWEWVEDCYVMPYPANTPTDGSAYLGPEGCDRRVSKGGSWGSTIVRQIPTFRGRDPETLTSQVFGFRIARDLK
ncbi:MAG: SUMF1/EgtB/PvdO family nonheme iron enzyme [Rhodospirillaceae bacterium]|nr:SUMF1/EgtB/PvdO family nonheme iron enzyme [Rhodospirillaceae bacterium]